MINRDKQVQILIEAIEKEKIDEIAPALALVGRAALSYGASKAIDSAIDKITNKDDEEENEENACKKKQNHKSKTPFKKSINHYKNEENEETKENKGNSEEFKKCLKKFMKKHGFKNKQELIKFLETEC